MYKKGIKREETKTIRPRRTRGAHLEFAHALDTMRFDAHDGKKKKKITRIEDE